ncbi:unnamed protein product [Clonostachys rosea]|uniref:DUF7704 domain-containing protein n=1 Tax=Bionectria ochroleuca TaxID=29856 RepID=A0ABY6UXB6_BIOOC|nr:unnamed protein product [Clonostachys rosea]
MNLLFAFNLAVTLRAAGNDHKLWRVLCSGMLLSDAMHVYATVREFGWPAVLDYNSWRTIDWLNFGIMGCMTVVRVCVVAGLGLGKGGKTTTTTKKSLRSAKSTASLNSTTSAASTPPPVSEPPSEKSAASAAGSAPKKAKSTKTGKKTGGRAKKAESVTGKQ